MSWSGARSHAVAEVLSWWVKCVLQAAKPWISSEDLDRGSLWFSEINNSLSDTSVGIVCLTDENKDRPWVLFEAGALAKGLSNSRVCTFLVDLEPKDITDPLAQFNHTKESPDDMKKLARTLNAALGTGALDTNLLNDICDVYWPKFKEKFDKALIDFPPAAPKVDRPEGDVLGDILEAVRGMNQRIRKLETNGEQMPFWDESRGFEISRRNRLTALEHELRTALAAGGSIDDILRLAIEGGAEERDVRGLVREISANFVSPKHDLSERKMGIKVRRNPDGSISKG